MFDIDTCGDTLNAKRKALGRLYVNPATWLIQNRSMVKYVKSTHGSVPFKHTKLYSAPSAITSLIHL